MSLSLYLAADALRLRQHFDRPLRRSGTRRGREHQHGALAEHEQAAIGGPPRRRHGAVGLVHDVGAVVSWVSRPWIGPRRKRLPRVQEGPGRQPVLRHPHAVRADRRLGHHRRYGTQRHGDARVEARGSVLQVLALLRAFHAALHRLGELTGACRVAHPRPPQRVRVLADEVTRAARMKRHAAGVTRERCRKQPHRVAHALQPAVVLRPEDHEVVARGV